MIDIEYLCHILRDFWTLISIFITIFSEVHSELYRKCIRTPSTLRESQTILWCSVAQRWCLCTGSHFQDIPFRCHAARKGNYGERCRARNYLWNIKWIMLLRKYHEVIIRICFYIVMDEKKFLWASLWYPLGIMLLLALFLKVMVLSGILSCYNSSFHKCLIFLKGIFVFYLCRM